jgi:CMP/dCMP kinase
MKVPSVITIDGPAASGKSTLGQLLAQQLGYLYFDAGVIYRALTAVALQHDLNLKDEETLVNLANQMNLRILPSTEKDNRQYTVLVDEQDITWLLRLPEVERNIPQVTHHPLVWKALNTQKRHIGSQGNIVMVGRDIGVLVMPDADLKIFLVASLKERASRRQRELIARNHPCSYEEVLADLYRRDELDQSYSFIAPDARILASDSLKPLNLVETILNWFI